MIRPLAAGFVLLLGCIVAGCGDGSPTAAPAAAETAPASRLAALRGGDPAFGFETADRPRAFSFPRDHGPHPSFRHEWWYVTGHLDAPGGQPFGFELTFFRFALVPAGSRAVGEREDRRSAWRAHQIYMAHFAVTDLERRRFFATARYERDALGLAGARATPFRVWLDDWSLGVPDSAGDDADSRWKLEVADGGYALDLELRPLTGPVLNGDAGLSRKSDEPGAASYYYSMPRIALSGRIVRDGRPLEVRGLAWLDREWGSGSLGADQEGWDWFALQLDDGSALMFYALRKRNGQRDAHSAGTWLSPEGSTRALASEDVRIDVQEHWTSPRGGRYPSRWRLRVPSLALDVDIRPRLADQELQTDPRYWEGAAVIEGTRAGQPVGGRAYVELVGYARSGPQR